MVRASIPCLVRLQHAISIHMNICTSDGDDDCASGSVSAMEKHVVRQKSKALEAWQRMSPFVIQCLCYFYSVKQPPQTSKAQDLHAWIWLYFVVHTYRNWVVGMARRCRERWRAIVASELCRLSHIMDEFRGSFHVLW